MDPTYSRYLVEYYHDGAFWGITIQANSYDDAEARVKQLQYAKLRGEVRAEIPAKLGFLARALCWARSVL